MSRPWTPPRTFTAFAAPPPARATSRLGGGGGRSQPSLVTALPASAQTVGGWPQFQGGRRPHRRGCRRPGARVLGRRGRLAVAPGGPGNAIRSVGARSVAGDLVVAVGPEAVVGVDARSGRAGVERRSRSRTVGCPRPRDHRWPATLVVYTEGFGDGPPIRRRLRHRPPRPPAPRRRHPVDRRRPEDEPVRFATWPRSISETQEPLWDAGRSSTP